MMTCITSGRITPCQRTTTHQTKTHQKPPLPSPNHRLPTRVETNAALPRGWAEGNRYLVADPFEIAVDAAAGVRLFESKRDRQVAIKFGEGRPEDKPSQAVIDKLKEAGFRWNRTDKIWAHPLTPDSAMSVRIEAERLYQEVRGMIRQEKGIESEPRRSLLIRESPHVHAPDLLPARPRPRGPGHGQKLQE